jgi:signal transduction histidine kinase/CheY-like chemotaxis protein
MIDPATLPQPVRDRLAELEGQNTALQRQLQEVQTALETVRTERQQLHAALEAAGIGTWRWDARTNEETWDAHQMQLFGVDPARFRPTLDAFFSCVHPEDRGRIRALMDESIGRRVPYLSEFRIVRPDGSTRWLAGRGQPHFDAQGQLLGLVGVNFDITDRKQAEGEQQRMERRLQESQRLESIATLAGGVAHDFNNLLTSILGYASLAAADLPSASAIQPFLEQIQTSAQQAAALCRQLLAYAGKSLVVFQPLRLSDLLAEMRPFLQTVIGPRAVLHLEAPTDLPWIQGDPAQVRQLVLNLTTNAVEALGVSGTVRVGVSVQRVGADFFRSGYRGLDLQEGEYLHLEVSDNGCGIAPADLERIFDPFFTTKFPGRGLGLAAVLGIVRAHRGGIKVVSIPGRGSSFTVLLPPSAAPAVPGPRSSAQDRPTVLVVDDQDAVRTLAEHVLDRAGYRVLTARDGQEGGDVFAQHAALIRLVLLDVSMPQRSGLECLREIRRLRTDVPVVLMSGHSRDEIDLGFTGHELAGVLEKPFTPGLLLDVVRRAVPV